MAVESKTQQGDKKLPKLERITGKKLIKHAPPRIYAYNDTKTVIHIKSSTPFISAVKRIEKSLKFFQEKYNKKGKPINGHKNVEYIAVHGMGKTVVKVVNLALHFQYEQRMKVDIFTKTIGVLDEFKSETDGKLKSDDDEEDDDDDDDVLRKRNVSSVEVRIYLDK
ncbi:hypothetical protein CANARDRAFT_26503 [[Candida] arabinofermentans NRRL YB-2248]|uniref:Uncharacterized protein n=1 Tax=[Candida] arabinofermentans NRRL YB-2248 TaxID=983967 RepID=A0A1E4T5N1_9ASCO|nr:hypothetical protein CANARDRAFT_26503 [[Candida] arabinofermentans NRRL YB-2248]